ncbi:hypothetical protein NMY22_g7143 [Coprinellus aureogranulatus]|nr:hypothetical protein NMY22_g7143 [Coprinellus aureogranulatus]
MAVSAADVRSALSLPDSSTAGPSNPKKQANATRKPEGISRELYSLIGTSQPALAAQGKPRLKQKPKFAGGASPATRWQQRPFKNPARKDNLQLKHWVKASEDPETEYHFSKYNIQNPIYTYSQDEYNRFLDTSNRSATPKDGKVDLEKKWTKEQTDMLFKLYHDYDGRWHVIWDRADFAQDAGFDLEDLKHRYYSVCRKLVRNRPWPGDEASRAALINSLQFDLGEFVRHSQGFADAAQNASKCGSATSSASKAGPLNKLLKKRLCISKYGLWTAIYCRRQWCTLGILPELSNRGPSKKRKNLTDTEPSTPGAGSSSSSVKRPQNTKSAAYDAQHCIIRTELSSNMPATKAAHQPAYARSSKIPYLKNNSMQPKILQCFAEMGLSPSRLVMPTKENVQQLEGLLEAVSAMLDTKKHLDKVEYDIQVAKKQLAMRNGEIGEGDEEGALKSEDAMDVDQGAETEGNDGRGASVVSVRSARSRKKVRSVSSRREAGPADLSPPFTQNHRSMSISSVDTAATSVSTRKRQKRG